ncbi:TonB-dependent receptor [Novosphingobium sp. FSY-8]|uniref:TonB-dependent receptor n=1 Tax=Novosphingobium ovatum TaxID=1908523 RepID=A0ABW9X963_9SPHN|nr:TonB-dependent receptor [Novosphingobium ovatum]NBC35063.1 TonB-dependent receptor [Novosphingobium ovatum]
MNIRFATLLLSGAAACVVAQPAMAQQTPAAAPATAEPAAPGDIVVTAQKRSERLQDVPLAVTAVTADGLATRGITDTKNLTQISPTLTYQQGNNASNSSFRIRGIGTAVFGQGTESSVSTVLDGVVMARQAQGFSDLADIERIEVLRGPQGTLFGKNSTGGVISVVTARPTNTLTGKVNVTVAEKGEYHLNGTIAGPISHNARVRISGFYNSDDGYIYNTTLRRKTNGSDSWGLRGKLDLDLGRLNLLLTADYSKAKAFCCQSVVVRSDNASLTTLLSPVVPGPDNTQVASNGDTTSSTTSQVYSLEAKYDLDFASLTSITAWQYYSFNNTVDVDGLNTATPIYTGTNAVAQYDVNGGPFTLGGLSQELRLSSNGKNRLNYTVGGYFSDVTLDREFTRRFVNCTASGLTLGAVCPATNLAGFSGHHQAHLRQNQIAGFAQADFAITGGLKALGGLRWQHEFISVWGKQDRTAPFAGDSILASGYPLTEGYTGASDSVLTGKIGLQYEFSRRAQMYATYTRGYKGQSLGTEFTQTFNNNVVVDPETVNAFEIGFKGSTADRKISIAAAFFMAKYKNLQVQANRSDPSTNTFTFVTTNAGASETKGVEIELTLRPTEALTINLTGAYTHARFDADGIGCPLQNQAAFATIAYGAAQPANTCFKQRSSTGTLSGAIQNVRGGLLPNTPEWRLTFNPRYEMPVGHFTGYADLNVAYQSSVNFSLEQDPLQTQRAYTTVDATVGLRQDRGLSLSLFVKNLTDQRYYTSMGTPGLFTTQTVTPTNRTAFLPKGAFRYFGVNVGYKF